MEWNDNGVRPQTLFVLSILATVVFGGFRICFDEGSFLNFEIVVLVDSEGGL